MSKIQSFSFRVCSVAVLFVLLATACGSADESGQLPDVGNPSAETSESNAPAETPGSTESASTGANDEPACDYIGLSSLGWMLLEVSMTNNSGSLMDGRLNYAVYDDDSLVMEGREVVTRLDPGESLRFFRNSQTEIPADAGEIRCEVTGFEDGFNTSPAYDEAAGGGCTPTEMNNVNTVEVDVAVVNQLGSAAELIADFAVYGPDGVRLGANSHIVTEVQSPGDLVEFSADSRAKLPDGLSLADLTCTVIALAEW